MLSLRSSKVLKKKFPKAVGRKSSKRSGSPKVIDGYIISLEAAGSTSRKRVAFVPALFGLLLIRSWMRTQYRCAFGKSDGEQK
jgi:hypothetical protein